MKIALRVLLAMAITSLLWECTQNTDQANSFPADPLERLITGNQRFVHSKSIHPDVTAERRQELVEGQKPYAVIISCSDSRVPPEIIFDEGLGDLFVIRTAGNLVDSIELGSVEYAIAHLGVGYIMVLGHENCGVIQAFLEHGPEHGHISKLIAKIGSEEEEQELLASGETDILAYVKANIRHTAREIIDRSDIVRHAINTGNLRIGGYIYHLYDGSVKSLIQLDKLELAE